MSSTETQAAIGPDMATAVSDAAHELRKRVPRSSLAEGVPEPADRDPVEILHAQDSTRVAELVPIRYQRMLVSPFTFYRGAAALMATDLAAAPATGLQVQLCGDAHLANFGGFAAPDRHLIFDVNDFDETLPGPFEWDLKRLIASFAVAGRDRGFPTSDRDELLQAVSRGYREAMSSFASMARLDVWYARMDGDELADRYGDNLAGTAAMKRLRKSLKKAGRKDSAHAFSRYTTVGPDGRLRPISDPPLVVPLEDIVAAHGQADTSRVIEQALARYRNTLSEENQHLLDGYRYVGAARKVVGVGSVGTRCWILLMVAKDDDKDDLVLQFKEAGPSVLEPYAGASEHKHHGQRVVEGQRLMQAASDILLGWQTLTDVDGNDRHFYVRQMWDGKISARLDKMELPVYHAYAEMCSWTLARAHARSGDRKAIAAYLGSSSVTDSALARFGEDYADQNERDFAAVKAAAADGRVPLAT